MSATPQNDALEDRLLELEAKLALSEDMQEALNTALYRQQQHIDRLERELRALRDQGLSAFSLPVLTIVVASALSLVFAALAAFLPARRAAGSDVLEAIATT